MLRHTTRVTGSFSYEAVLPAPVDEEGHGRPADGVLTITMPKATEAKTHITVKYSSVDAGLGGGGGPLDQRPLRLVERPSRARRGGGARPGGPRRVPDRPAPR